MPVKILHIIKSLGRGGAETLLPATLALHNKDEFEFHYIYFLSWKNQVVKEIELAGGTVTCMAATHNIAIMQKAKQVMAYIRKHDIQLVHCHLPWAGFLGRYLSRSIRIPVLYTEHNKQERYHFITRWLNRLTFNQMNTAIAVSADVAESIQKNIRPSIPVVTILNGVNTNDFRRNVASGLQIREQLGIPAHAVVIGTLAVFRFQKRLPEWIRVFASLADQHPDLYGIIVGEGVCRPAIEAELDKWGLRGRILLPGLQFEVKPWLSAMDIFMMSSIFEGLPIALLEAMSMECAIVATDAGGIKQVIRHKQDGWVCGVEDWEKLSEGVQLLLKDTRLLKEYGYMARQRAIHAFSLQQMVDQLEDLYQKVLGI